MSSAQSHYDQLLGSVYTWMAGGWDAALARNRELLDSLGLATWPRGVAVDLGCGSGFQAVPLADAGFEVVALDLCEPLLAELRAHAGPRPILAVRDDLLNFSAHLTTDAALIVCMGDTLTHLPSLDAVTTLVRTAAARLQPGGRLILGFRDLTSHPLTGTARFIPIRSDADRIFTCCLDYHADSVEVTDLLHRREGDGWQFSASSYRKLRLASAQVAAVVTAAGLTVEVAMTERGLVRVMGVKV
jgi:SAM-dependent methyltransferase